MGKISEMRNLGPTSEEDFKAAGIHDAAKIVKLGPKKAFNRMLEGRMKRGKSVKCCNALYLYAIYGAIHDVDWRQIPAKKQDEFKAYTKALRDSGKIDLIENGVVDPSSE
ncbi:MAG: hypothetical protein GKS01_14265 [Alphaproteobacteria bacterium]|nr:hypothetical protein [Alphaproteobacteria bacterium]